MVLYRWFLPGINGYPWNRYFSATETVKSNYYELGANTLLDDIILNDGSGTANTFLGKTAKVIPFTPGVNTNVTDGGVVPDPYREWTTNTTSHRLALKNLDGDNGKISSAIAGTMTIFLIEVVVI